MWFSPEPETLRNLWGSSCVSTLFYKSGRFRYASLKTTTSLLWSVWWESEVRGFGQTTKEEMKNVVIDFASGLLWIQVPAETDTIWSVVKLLHSFSVCSCSSCLLKVARWFEFLIQRPCCLQWWWMSWAVMSTKPPETTERTHLLSVFRNITPFII